MPFNRLYYGDNLDVLRHKIQTNTVDLCYIDPPFNSKRNYNQIYNNVGTEDKAQAQAFIDTWTWDDFARTGHTEILDNAAGRFQPQLVELIKGFSKVLGQGSLLAYLVSMALRITEIQRVLKPAGVLYLHCDPTASHYLKLVLDAAFCPVGGDFINEIVWCYESGGRGKSHFPRKHDVIFWYSKTRKHKFIYDKVALQRDFSTMHETIHTDKDGRTYQTNTKNGKTYKYFLDKGVLPNDWWADIQALNPAAKERLGYPTQKPEALLERIINASSEEGDLVLDAYCGCGTTIAVAQRLKRRWIGMDITYQSVSLILRRLEYTFGAKVLDGIRTDGIPRDMESAMALAQKKDDRLRKEFEKWAILTFTNNRAIINEKKGADAGVDGVAFFKTGKNDNARIIFQVKSGRVERGDIAKLRGDMGREEAAMACLITLDEPSGPMRTEAKGVGQFKHEDMGRSYDKISIVTIKEIVVGGKRLEIPMSLEVLAAAKRALESEQHRLL